MHCKGRYTRESKTLDKKARNPVRLHSMPANRLLSEFKILVQIPTGGDEEVSHASMVVRTANSSVSSQHE